MVTRVQGGSVAPDGPNFKLTSRRRGLIRNSGDCPLPLNRGGFIGIETLKSIRVTSMFIMRLSPQHVLFCDDGPRMIVH